MRLPASSRSPVTPSTPSGHDRSVRLSARTGLPLATSAASVAPPMLPVAPVIRIMSWPDHYQTRARSQAGALLLHAGDQADVADAVDDRGRDEGGVDPVVARAEPVAHARHRQDS